MTTVRIRLLGPDDDTQAFTCGEEVLDRWLRTIASQHSRKGISRTYVAADDAVPNEILGYYSLTAGEISSADLPEKIGRKLPHKIPIILIGRLAVSQSRQGQGLGGMLMVHALKQTQIVAAHVGVAAAVVDAKDEPAAKFYEHLGFQRLPDQPLRLILPVSGIAAYLPP